ncbi:MAG TPA: hypothetical protein PKA30_04255 [Accumulibacter sp.]|uniref:hypothetical protein n=1 Tax=Accumulibacter sp. TaxID=2053492 RepID=UPI0028783DC2|nr:hypothetical protein [Accumulibacter sp.]HNN08541.1 hypothetical protein [Azospira sp.]MDS4077445.1 hypothetical protein [Accumulibacter sp.]HMV04746.1 hypothetical protein [Accumulibacter sp.]HMW81204.1 hypothetical protein [Accumulibacter sp.]HNB68928.1 hypothetical protein [Accumulibacter sp.]
MTQLFVDGAAWQALPALAFAVLLAGVFVLIIRQNRKDLVELEEILANESGEW